MPVTQVRTLLEHTPVRGAALSSICIQRGEDGVTVVNVHGVTSLMLMISSIPRGCLVQSEYTIIGAFHGLKQPVIIGGDFNLLPKVDSIMGFC